MRLGTQLTIGLTVVALGIGVVALGFVDQEAAVRQVSDVTRDPGAHTTGTYTLVGIPQPEILTTFASGGEAVQQPNPAHRNETRHHVAWDAADGTRHVSTLILRVDGPDADGVSHWSLWNETRVPGRGLVGTPARTDWTVTGPHTVILIEGFPDDGETPRMFGVYEGVLREPLQPKPSQFEGRVATALPGGVPVPDGAVVFAVEEYTAGCSSKFIPEEHRDEYADDAADPE